MTEESTRQALNSARRAWYAVHTRPQHEKVIAEGLKNKGIEVFLPMYLCSRRWKDRTKQLLLPLFPCYLFVFDWVTGCKIEILKTPGVYQIVGFCGRATEISAAEIAALRTVSSCLTVEPHPLLRCGDAVRVRRGPLVGLEGILVRKKNAYRLVLSVEALGKALSVEVDASDVERIPNKGPVLTAFVPENRSFGHCAGHVGR